MIVTLNLFQGLVRKIDAETSSAGRISGEVAALCRFIKNQDEITNSLPLHLTQPLHQPHTLYRFLNIMYP